MVATLFQLAIKFFDLVQLAEVFTNDLWLLSLIFVVYHSLARMSAIQLSFLLQYVREYEKSKAKPIAKQHSIKEVLGVLVFRGFPFLVLVYSNPIYLLILVPLVITIFYFKYYPKKWIGGYTSDCLGAVEQLCECIILLSFIALWKFI